MSSSSRAWALTSSIFDVTLLSGGRHYLSQARGVVDTESEQSLTPWACRSEVTKVLQRVGAKCLEPNVVGINAAFVMACMRS